MVSHISSVTDEVTDGSSNTDLFPENHVNADIHEIDASIFSVYTYPTIEPVPFGANNHRA
jgi:hypothetical protein